MSKQAETNTERWKREAIIAYHTKAYQESFECYWDVTRVLRGDNDAKWAEAKKIKMAAWNAEEAKNS